MATLDDISKKLEKKRSDRDLQRPANEPCPIKNPPVLYVMVARQDNYTEISGINVEAQKSQFIKSSESTGGDGIASFDPAEIKVRRVVAALSPQQTKQFLPPDPSTVSTEAGKTTTALLLLPPVLSLKINVVGEKDNKPVKDVMLYLMGQHKPEWKTGADGSYTIEGLRPGEYDAHAKLLHGQLRLYGQPQQVKHTLSEQKKELTIRLPPPTRHVYLRLQFRDPEGKDFSFPSGFKVSVLFNDGTSPTRPQDPEVLDDQGSVNFDVPPGKTWFTLKFNANSVRYVVQKRKENTWEPDNPAILNDPSEADLQKLTLEGKRFFSLPKEWSLSTSDWAGDGVKVEANGQIKIEDKDIGSPSEPGKLTLTPKYLHVRFEYYDRKFWASSAHNKKRISIPPVVLKGWHSDRTVPLNHATPGDPDTVCNWDLQRSSLSKACQAISWILTKKNDGSGAARPKLSNKLLIQFGWEKGYVFSKTEFVRQIVVLDPKADGTDAQKADAKKLQPGIDRVKYYDFPKLWQCANYYTRLDDTQGKFFDELTDAEIEGAYAKDKPLKFSLDDIVLVDGLSQAVKDQDTAGTPQDLSKHSRFTILHLDPDDKYKVKVWEERPKAVYHSNKEFGKAGNTYRNVILDYPPNPRVVVFCNGFYDVFDKRTVRDDADASPKKIVGARAAKLNDGDVSLKKRFDSARDVNRAYVHRERTVDVYYLHYGGTDGTTVYGALITHWSGWFWCKAADKPAAWDVTRDDHDLASLKLTNDVDHIRKYMSDGMKNAMTRWNEKDYQFEESDDKKDIVIKTFFLFEGKGVEDPATPGTFIATGGPPRFLVAIGSDASNSWATESTMLMAYCDYGKEDDWDEEKDKHGNLPKDYDGRVLDRWPFAHELGHASVGLYDDYITGRFMGIVPGYQSDQRYPGVVYKRDKCSIMSVNRAPRLRQLWGKANWLNDEAQPAAAPDKLGTLQKFLGSRRFKITYAPARKPKLEFSLDEGSRNIYQPTHQEANVSLGEKGVCDLYLYKLGTDEFASLLPGGPYDGILVAETRIKVVFKRGLTPAPAPWVKDTAYAVGACVEQGGNFYVCRENDPGRAVFAADAKWVQCNPDGSSFAWAAGHLNPGRWYKEGANWHVCLEGHDSVSAAGSVTAGKLIRCTCSPAEKWTPAQQSDWVSGLNKAIVAMIESEEGKFWLEGVGTTNGAFAKVYLRVFARWWDGVGKNPHFTCEVLNGGPDKYYYTNDSTIKVAKESYANTHKTLIRYLYGKIGGTDDLKKGDWGKLKEWMESKAGGTCAVNEIT